MNDTKFHSSQPCMYGVPHAREVGAVMGAMQESWGPEQCSVTCCKFTETKGNVENLAHRKDVQRGNLRIRVGSFSQT